MKIPILSEDMNFHEVEYLHKVECTKRRLGCIVNVASILSITLLSFKKDLFSLDASNINLKLRYIIC